LRFGGLDRFSHFVRVGHPPGVDFMKPFRPKFTYM
jgi:hypothetical protein